MDKTTIRLKGFKCFVDNEFDLHGLTLLTGANATGKSSLIQALLLAESTLSSGRREESSVMICLNDPNRALEMGQVDNILNKKVDDDEALISIDGCELKFKGGDKVSTGFLSMHVSGDRSCLLDNLYYLNAERLGPRLETDRVENHDNDCGCHGEKTASVVINNEFTKIGASRLRNLDSGEKNFRIALNDWLDWLFPSITINVIGSNTKTQILVNNANLGMENFATNVGFGISYALPILVTCLLAKEGGVVIIENPEAHLHAKAQSNMGYFLGVMAASGLKLIVETHSEHIINGMRRAIVIGERLKPEDIVIYFFEQTSETIVNHTIRVDAQGNLSHFPVDFFDQQRQDSKEMFEHLMQKSR